MIKFFRQIRTKKYLLYAIGEIILVVIGILIALQINNWNDRNNRIINEQKTLVSLSEEIKKNIQRLETTEKMNDSFTRSAQGIIFKIKNNDKSFTTQELSESFNYTTGVVDSPILDGIIASDSDVLVKKKELIEYFRDLQNFYDRIKKSEYYLDEFWNLKITDFFVSGGFFFEGFSGQDPAITMKDIQLAGYTEKQFIALLNMKINLEDYFKMRRQAALEKSYEVLEILENETAE